MILLASTKASFTHVKIIMIKKENEELRYILTIKGMISDIQKEIIIYRINILFLFNIITAF